MSEASLVEAYIRSEESPDGKWWVEVPVGLSVQEQQSQTASLKNIDAVCLTSQPPHLPERYPDYAGSMEYTNPDIPESGVSRAKLFRRLRESDYFEEESATIVEAKTGASSFKAIGQLQAYKQLLEEDYGWSVEEQILLSNQRDPVIDHAASSLDIRVVAVQ